MRSPSLATPMCEWPRHFSPSEVGGDHFRSSAVFLTQAHPKQTQGSDITCGTSLDQLHAQHFGQATPLPSLQLSIEPTDKGGGCDYNYSCSYTDCISWSAPNEPMPMIRNPRTVFDLLFGAGGTARGRAERRRTQASILDWVVGEVASMNTQLGAADRRRIDQYLSSVREVERRIQMTEASNDGGEPRALPDAPAGIPDSYSEHLKILFDLEVLAFESDITRIVSLKTGRDASNRTFPESGSDRAFHPASHHGDKESGILEFNRICQYRVAQLDYLLERLQATHDRGVPLLEQTAILWGSPMGDANLHNHKRCPLVIFGGANGRLTHGRHIKAPDGTPMANAMLALMTVWATSANRSVTAPANWRSRVTGTLSTQAPLLALVGAAFILSTAKPSDAAASELAMAAQRGDLSTVRALLRGGAEVNEAMGDGMSALHWAAERGDSELASLLIYAGAKPDVGTRIGSYTPLHIAARAGRGELIEQLLAAGADPQAATTNSYVQPIHLAASSGSARALQALILAGADVNAREGAWGQTPLTFAAAANRVDALRVLLEAGANPSLASAVVDTAEQERADKAAEKRLEQFLADFKERKAAT